MSGWLRDWLLGLMSAALLGAIVTGAAGEDSRAARLSSALALLLVLCSPLVHFELDETAQLLSRSRMQAQMAQTGIEVKNRELLSRIISEQAQTYILDKAEELGVTVAVTVQTQQGEAYPYPAAVQLTGYATAAQRGQLNRWIAEQLAIAEEHVTWTEP